MKEHGRGNTSDEKSFRVDCTLCRIKQMLVLKNGRQMGGSAVI